MPILKKQYKKAFKSLIPPVLVNKYRSMNKKYGWFGNYSSWEEAKKRSVGYETHEILEKVKNSLLKVKNGEAVYERDSILFDKIEYSWPLLAGLTWIAAQNSGKLSVLDFGGSLGSSYFQNKKFLQTLSEVKWNIVEQKKFIQCGKKYFENNELKFYEDIKNCMDEQKPQVVLFSCILQYVEEPYEILQSILSFSPPYIIIDNMPFIESGNDRITIQKVSPEIYNASYPCWFLNKKKFMEFLDTEYELISDFQSHLYIYLDGKRIPYQGFILKKR